MIDDEDSKKNKLISSWFREIAVAGAFLTRLPFRIESPIRVSDLGSAVHMFPVIGLIAGSLGAAAFWIAAQIGLNSIASGAIGLAAVVWITGALHEDGLADFFDGISAWNRDRRLEIMRDSSIGAFGVLALIFSIVFKVSILAELLKDGIAFSALIAAVAISRGMMPLLMYFMKPARADGLGSEAGRPSGKAVGMAVIISGLISGILFDGWSAILILFSAAIVVMGLGLLAQRRLGGYTGDVLGAAQQFAEISVLAVAGAYAV